MGWVTVGEGDEARHIFIGSGGKVLATRSAISKASGGTERGKALASRSKAAIAKASAKPAAKSKPKTTGAGSGSIAERMTASADKARDRATAAKAAGNRTAELQAHEHRALILAKQNGFKAVHKSGQGQVAPGTEKTAAAEAVARTRAARSGATAAKAEAGAVSPHALAGKMPIGKFAAGVSPSEIAKGYGLPHDFYNDARVMERGSGGFPSLRGEVHVSDKYDPKGDVFKAVQDRQSARERGLYEGSRRKGYDQKVEAAIGAAAKRASGSPASPQPPARAAAPGVAKATGRQANISAAVKDHLSGKGAADTIRQTIADRVNPLVQRGSRQSAFRPEPGTPKFRAAVEQAKLERQFKQQSRPPTSQPKPAATPAPAARASVRDRAATLREAHAGLASQIHLGGLPKPPAPSLREQAAAARAGKGLSPEERATAAATKYSFWRSGAPTSGLGAARSSRQEASSKVIEAGAAKNPAAYAKARAEVEAKIAAFQAKRGTPELKLSPSGAKLKVKEYDNWQQFKGTKEVSSAPERERYAATSSGYGKKEQIGVLLARKSWDEHDLKQAEGHVKSGDAPAELKQQVKDYKATGARTALEPSKSDVLRQRKLQGITGRIKPVITKR